MLPQNALSSQTLAGSFLPPDDSTFDPQVDKELGGIALNDSSQGLEVQTWQLMVSGDNLVLSADTVAPFVLLTRPATQWVSLAFDQNMRVAVAYVQYPDGGDPVAKFYWYDGTIPGYRDQTLPAGVLDPRLALDDKRFLQRNLSDIILAYTRNGNLYFRGQRDRYLIEYQLATGVTGTLRRLGMNTQRRLQFELSNEPY